MNRPAEALLTALLAAHRQGRRLALLFDYDGTLTPLQPHPDLARLDPSARRLLERLARRPQIALGFLSGRTLKELQTLVALPEAYYAGTTGLELDLRGQRVVHPEAPNIAPSLAQLGQRLQRILPAYSGAWLEDKQWGLTVHYRAVQPDRIAALQTELQDVAESSLEQFRFIEGPRAVEIIPRLGWSKATAVDFILEALQQNLPSPVSGEGPGVRANTDDMVILPFYAGDSVNDEDAMEKVNSLGGLSVGVGPQAPPAAAYRLPNPVALHDLLTRFEKSL
ncbi:MAG: trehalose-phosphatase [Pirellulales bacterium]|nr:trehalose-phosphatase [Pirellulales bacterium]